MIIIPDDCWEGVEKKGPPLHRYTCYTATPS